MKTILDKLELADGHLFRVNIGGQTMVDNARAELAEAMELLIKGYDVHDDIDLLKKEYGQIKNVPFKKENTARLQKWVYSLFGIPYP